jgi:dipeptidyl aminopeptidase/acylaminoacyl peptidase
MLDPAQLEPPHEYWVCDLTRATLARLPVPGLPFPRGVWNPDGQRIAVGLFDNDTRRGSIWERRADGTGEPVLIYRPAQEGPLLYPLAWTPDGAALAVCRWDLGSTFAEVLLLRREAQGTNWIADEYLRGVPNGMDLQFSPDGRLVCYASDESGRPELYVQRFTGSGSEDASAGRHQVSNGGWGQLIWWSPDGKEIRYIDSESRVMSVQMNVEPTLSTALPKPLFGIKDLTVYRSGFAPDGRLLAVLQGEGERANRINVVVNFFDEMRARTAAAGKER